jgi:hypothetical protein
MAWHMLPDFTQSHAHPPGGPVHLTRKKAFPLLFFSAIACHDSTGPATITAQFELANINGRPVPTYLSPTPGLTPTILSASLTFDRSQKVVMTENRREWDGTETTTTHTFDYRINGNQIAIGCFEPVPTIPGVGVASVVCIGNYTGTISGRSLSLIVAPPSPDGSITYNYRLK